MAHSEVPANTESIRRMPHQLTFGTDALEKHDELQFKEDHRINGGTPSASIGLLHQFAHKRQVKCALQVPIEVILRYQFFQGHIDEWSTAPLLLSHHRDSLPSSHLRFLLPHHHFPCFSIRYAIVQLTNRLESSATFGMIQVSFCLLRVHQHLHQHGSIVK